MLDLANSFHQRTERLIMQHERGMYRQSVCDVPHEGYENDLMYGFACSDIFSKICNPAFLSYFSSTLLAQSGSVLVRSIFSKAVELYELPSVGSISLNMTKDHFRLSKVDTLDNQVL